MDRTNKFINTIRKLKQARDSIDSVSANFLFLGLFEQYEKLQKISAKITNTIIFKINDLEILEEISDDNIH